MGREALEANVIGGTSHETPAGVRSQSGSIHASELDLQSNDTVELSSFRLGSTSPLIQLCFQVDEEELSSTHLPQESPTRRWGEARGGGRWPS